MSKYNGKRYAEKRAAGLCGSNACANVAAPFSRCEVHRRAMAVARTPNPKKRGKFHISKEHIDTLLQFLWRTEPFLRNDWDVASAFIILHSEVFFTKASAVLDHSSSLEFEHVRDLCYYSPNEL